MPSITSIGPLWVAVWISAEAVRPGRRHDGGATVVADQEHAIRLQVEVAATVGAPVDRTRLACPRRSRGRSGDLPHRTCRRSSRTEPWRRDRPALAPAPRSFARAVHADRRAPVRVRAEGSRQIVKRCPSNISERQGPFASYVADIGRRFGALAGRQQEDEEQDELHRPPMWGRQGLGVDAELGELAVERRAPDPEPPCDLGHLAAIMADGEADEVAFDLFERAEVAVGLPQRDPLASRKRGRSGGGADFAGIVADPVGEFGLQRDVRKVVARSARRPGTAARRGTGRSTAGGHCPASRSASAPAARPRRSTAG